MLTVPKTALAGVIVEISFARFMASIVAFNAETIPFLPLGCRDLVSMVETRGSCERRYGVEAVRKVPNPNRDERQFFHDTPHANGLIW